MLKINLIKKTFFRQSTEDNCGGACLAMLFNYSGKVEEALEVSLLEAPKGGFSLLDLKNIASERNLPCRCVEIDKDYLKQMSSPVILHTISDLGLHHFLVCYGFDKRRSAYLVADPAIQVHYIKEHELLDKWPFRAALFPENLEFQYRSKSFSGIIELMRQRSYPPGLLLTVPFLSICIAFFGIALTWLLQKGLSSAMIFQSNVIAELIFLLLIICFFKNLFSYLRQYILIRINLSTNRMLIDQTVDRILSLKSKHDQRQDFEIKNSLINVQRMQNAISTFISVILCDGSMVLILLASSFYVSPFAGLVNFIYLAAVISIEIPRIPEQIYHAEKTRTLSMSSEKAFIKYVQLFSNKPETATEKFDFKAYYSRNLDVANELAVKLSKRNLFLECLGTLNLIIILCIAAYLLVSGQVDYQSFMLVVIETYLITSLVQRICNSFQQIAEGIDATIAHSRT